MGCVCDKNFKKIIKEALDALGKKNFALIVHGSSFPSDECCDTGFGNPNSDGAKRIIDFVSGVFNAIQLGPQGKTKAVDNSPYTGTIFSGNPLFIDLKSLTQKEWGEILSGEVFKRICDNNPNKGGHKAAYSYIFKEQEIALREAFANFKKAGIFKKELKQFIEKNNFWLERDSLYEALSIEHKNDYFPLWKSSMDKNLFNPKNEGEKTAFDLRIEELKKKYKDEIEFYNFCQFVVFEQNEMTKEYAKKQGIKMIADRQVAFSDRDTWAYQSLFLEGWCLGCPPDYFSNDGQGWGFPVINPDKMFNQDGSLGEAGVLMKNLYTKMFSENPGGVRIDHIVGLIDPWVYKKGSKPKIEEGAGRLYSSPEHPELGRFAIARLEDLNYDVGADKEQRVKTLSVEQIQRYGALVEKIVIAAAKELGLDGDAIVCEDLGTLTYPVECVMRDYGLQGMRLTQFVTPEDPEHPYRGSRIIPESWAMAGTHDNEPVALWAEALMNTHKGYLHAKNLVEDLFREKSQQEQNDLIVKLTTDRNFMTRAKLVEIFASQAHNIQIFFTDFLGLLETYNTPGTSGDKNWVLRIPNDFEKFYYKSLDNGLGLDLPLVLRMAIEARGSEFVSQHLKLVEKLNEMYNLQKETFSKCLI